MRRRRFLGCLLPAHRLPLVWKPRAHEETDDRRCTAQPSGRYSSATLARMLVVHTRSHKQAAGTQYGGGLGGGEKEARNFCHNPRKSMGWAKVVSTRKSMRRHPRAC